MKKPNYTAEEIAELMIDNNADYAEEHIARELSEYPKTGNARQVIKNRKQHAIKLISSQLNKHPKILLATWKEYFNGGNLNN